jgi:hypothetical protein
MALEQANFYREQHGTSILIEDTYLKNFAQKHSNKLNELCMIVEDARLTKLNIGKTHFQVNSTDPFDFDSFDCEGEFDINTFFIYNLLISTKSYSIKKAHANDAIEKWYYEIQSYNFQTFESKDENYVNNFTQLIWNSSKKVGFGLSISKEKNPDNNLYFMTIVAYYSPLGNIAGEYLNNVFDINVL